MTTVTQWFEPNIKPVNTGKYETEAIFENGIPGTPTMDANWADGYWFWSSGFKCANQNRKWRGLAEKPQP